MVKPLDLTCLSTIVCKNYRRSSSTSPSMVQQNNHETASYCSCSVFQSFARTKRAKDWDAKHSVLYLLLQLLRVPILRADQEGHLVPHRPPQRLSFLTVQDETDVLLAVPIHSPRGATAIGSGEEPDVCVGMSFSSKEIFTCRDIADSSNLVPKKLIL